MELAKLQNGELIYGSYEECEAYAEQQDSCVDRYFDHINPSTVYKNFKYVGNSHTHWLHLRSFGTRTRIADADDCW